MPGTPGLPQQHRPLVGRRRSGVLQERRHLAGVKWVDTGIALGGGEQHGRILHALGHPVIRRVGVHPGELVGDVGVAVFAGPQSGDEELREPHHVEQWHRAPHGAGQVGALGECRTHQQSAVRATHHSEPIVRRHALRHQPVARTVEVVEHVLLGIASTRLVPRFTVLVAATQPGDCPHAPLGAPGSQVGHPRRRFADGEAAVAVEDEWCIGRRGHIGAVHHEQPDLGAVERRVVHVRHHDGRQLAGIGCIGAPPHRRATAGHSPHAGGLGERVHHGERNVGAGRAGIGGDLRDRHHTEAVDLLEQLTGQRPPFDGVDRGATGRHQHFFAQHGRVAHHHIGPLGDDRAPRHRLGLLVGGEHHAAVGRVERGEPDQPVGAELETRLRLHTFHHNGPLAGGQVEQMRIDAGPAHEHLHQHVPTVRRCRHIGPRLLVGQVVEHDGVAGRVGTECVMTDVAVVLIALGVAGVPEAASVVLPGHRSRTSVGDTQVAERGRGHVEQVQHAVLGAAFAETDGHHGPIG